MRITENSPTTKELYFREPPYIRSVLMVVERSEKSKRKTLYFPPTRLKI